MNLLGQLIINIIALLVVEYIVPGFTLESTQAILVAAVIIGVVNTFIKPVVQIIALPLSILTLGLTAFLVNVVLLWFVAAIVPGFEIDSFLTAALASILLALVSAFLHKVSK
jgi:putative membrane protein